MKQFERELLDLGFDEIIDFGFIQYSYLLESGSLLTYADNELFIHEKNGTAVLLVADPSINQIKNVLKALNYEQS